MDGQGLRQQAKRIQAVAAAEQAEEASTARAEKAARQVSPEDKLMVGNQLGKDLRAGFERLHNMKASDHPAVTDSVRVERRVGHSDITIFDLGDGAFVSIGRFTPPSDRPDLRPKYTMAVSDSSDSLMDPDASSHLNIGSVDISDRRGFYPLFSPGVVQANDLDDTFETMENMRTLEQELGLEPLLSVPFELPQAA